MNFKPFDRMWEHVEIAKDNSDVAYFNALMYMGEMFTKFVAAGMVATVDDGRDRQQYRLKYQLVRAEGIGDWGRRIDEVLTGVPAQSLIQPAHEEAKQLTQRTGHDEWQYESISLLHKCLMAIESSTDKLPKKSSGRQWFNFFAALRNTTRGHGATPAGKLARICDDLHQSITIFEENFILFQRSWGIFVANNENANIMSRDGLRMLTV